MREYIKLFNKNTELFSTSDPDTILDAILEFAKLQGYEEFKLSEDKYKLVLPILNTSG
jgi:hypothetical protein